MSSRAAPSTWRAPLRRFGSRPADEAPSRTTPSSRSPNARALLRRRRARDARGRRRAWCPNYIHASARAREPWLPQTRTSARGVRRRGAPRRRRRRAGRLGKTTRQRRAALPSARGQRSRPWPPTPAPLLPRPPTGTRRRVGVRLDLVAALHTCVTGRFAFENVSRRRERPRAFSSADGGEACERDAGLTRIVVAPWSPPDRRRRGALAVRTSGFWRRRARQPPRLEPSAGFAFVSLVEGGRRSDTAASSGNARSSARASHDHGARRVRGARCCSRDRARALRPSPKYHVEASSKAVCLRG